MSEQIYNCVVSGKPIPPERVEALNMLGTPKNQWTCVEHSLVRPRQGIYLGEVGTSKLLMVDRVYNDSIRSVFKTADRDTEEEAQAEKQEVEKNKFYSTKEINYYSQNDEDNSEDNAPVLRRLDS